MQIKIKYFDENITKLEKIQKGDWIDLRAREKVVLTANDFKLIPLNVAMELPNGYEAHVLPRSSTFKKWGILMTNSMGVIDNSYSGDGDEWLFPALATRYTVIEKGDRIAQFRIVENQPRLDIVEVDKLDGANRGGIGSTGKR